MRLLIDTSAYSAMNRGLDLVLDELGASEEVWVSSIVLGELRGGFAYGTNKRRNELDLQAFFDLPQVTTVGIDEETAVCYAAIYAGLRRAGTLMPTNDLWIAATAMQHGLIVFTQDAHFRLVPQIVVRGV